MALAASLIRRGALQHADPVAVHFGDEQLTFAQVNDTANRIAHHLGAGGYNVYPQEVENAIASHPAVAECAVVAPPDGTWVEAVTAFVTLRPGAQVDEQEVIAHFRGQLAAHKAPNSVYFVESIPKSPVGKILRRALREPLWDAQQQERAQVRP